MAFVGEADKVEGIGGQEEAKFRVKHNGCSVCVCFFSLPSLWTLEARALEGLEAGGPNSQGER